MVGKKEMKAVFSDKASLILRKMLREPQRRWVVRDFTESPKIGIGWVAQILDYLEQLGYVEREKRGPKSYTILTNREKLLEDWLREYSFSLNTISSFYSPAPNILPRIKAYLKQVKLGDQYALTLSTGANLVAPYVKNPDIYLYLKIGEKEKLILDMRQRLDLKELVRGGNVHIVRPYYKESIFFNLQKVKGYNIVSNLQLYLDLYHFKPRGLEHAKYLRERLEEKGLNLA